jgi:hypothetical protein
LLAQKLRLWDTLIMTGEQLSQRLLDALEKYGLVVQHNRPLVWTDVDVVRLGIQLNICEDER